MTADDAYQPLSEATTLDTLRRGDEIVVPRLGPRLVSSVGAIDDLAGRRLIVVYFEHDEESFENRARDKSGRNVRRRLVEKQLKPMPADEPILVIRGTEFAADETRARMERDQAERWAVRQTRLDRAEQARNPA